VHSRSGDNLTAHPEAGGIIRQASGFPRFDEFLGPRLALPAVQLATCEVPELVQTI
jgi:hypothetical protein